METAGKEVDPSVSLVALYAAGAIQPLSTSSAEEQERGRNGRASDGVETILGKDAFLRLLTTQLRYQDPLKPVDDHDFIAQMAQFSALEQMQNLSRSIELFVEEQRANNRMAMATSLLGRKVDVQSSSGMYTGTVDAIRMVDGVPRLVIGNVLFDVGDVVKVY